MILVSHQALWKAGILSRETAHTAASCCGAVYNCFLICNPGAMNDNPYKFLES